MAAALERGINTSTICGDVMSRQYQRYNKEDLQQLAGNSVSYTEICRKLGKKPTGGTITNLKLICERWKINCTHMTGSVHNKGQRAKNRTHADQRLVVGTSTDHRVTASKLRRALFEIGIAHKCNHCGISEWNGKTLVLEIDHKDECYWNNTRENLQFLCPNCHSQN